MPRSLLTPLALGLVLLGASGCAGFRGVWRGMNNDSLMGEAAPALTEGTWVAASGTLAAEEPRARWKLVVFFLPG